MQIIPLLPLDRIAAVGIADPAGESRIVALRHLIDGEGGRECGEGDVEGCLHEQIYKLGCAGVDMVGRGRMSGTYAERLVDGGAVVGVGGVSAGLSL